MLKLSDFFQPLNLYTLSFFVGELLFFDIFGTFIKKFFISNKKLSSETRIINWIIGFSLFVFIWFILGFFVYPSRINILISVIVLTLISLFSYIKSKQLGKLFVWFKPLLLPILLIVPFLPSTFVRGSLPPYYSDEMAYHFIPPNTLLYGVRSLWNFGGGVLMNAPRLMDTFYVLGFSVFRTYSVVRLTQFMLLATALCMAFLIIKKFLGKISAFTFVLIFLSMIQLSLPLTVTIGYVDVPAYTFLLVGLIFASASIFSKDKQYLILSTIFWGMSIGTKYPTFMAFAIFVISYLLVFWIKDKSFRMFFEKKFLLKLLIALLIFGGYWYVKNFIVYGNPLYPFIFPCWEEYAADCAVKSNFFGTWTTSVNFQNLYTIIRDLLSNNVFLHIALVVSPVLVLFYGNKKSKLFLLLLLLSFGLEMLFLKYTSGYYGRYHQHMQFFLILVIVLPLSLRFRSVYAKLAQILLIVALILSSLLFYYRNIRYLNTLGFVNWDEINYAVGKTDIYDWIKKRLPDMYEATVWCENPPGGKVSLARYDPDMIWYDDNGLMRSYLINCDWSNPHLSVDERSNLIEIAKERKLKFWTVSPNKCVAESEVKSKHEVNDPNNDVGEILEMRKLNNSIICNSEEVKPNLYYFDYEKLK